MNLVAKTNPVVNAELRLVGFDGGLGRLEIGDLLVELLTRRNIPGKQFFGALQIGLGTITRGLVLRQRRLVAGDHRLEFAVIQRASQIASSTRRPLGGCLSDHLAIDARAHDDTMAGGFEQIRYRRRTGNSPCSTGAVTTGESPPCGLFLGSVLCLNRAIEESRSIVSEPRKNLQQGNEKKYACN